MPNKTYLHSLLLSLRPMVRISFATIIAVVVVSGPTRGDCGAILESGEGIVIGVIRIKDDYARLGGKSKFVEGAAMDCGIASDIYGTVFAYNKDKFPAGGPSTMADQTTKLLRIAPSFIV